MKKCILVCVLIALLCFAVAYANKDIGAVQEGPGIDIGARESAEGAPPVTSIPIFMYHYQNH